MDCLGGGGGGCIHTLIGVFSLFFYLGFKGVGMGWDGDGQVSWAGFKRARWSVGNVVTYHIFISVILSPCK